MSLQEKKFIKRWRQFRSHPIAGKRFFKAWRNYIYFHLTKSATKDQKYKWIGKLQFLARPGDAGINPNIFLGLYEFNESCFLLHFLRPFDVFIDIGANLGHYSLLASGITHCSTIAVEPIPDTFAQLKKQVELNSLQSRIELINKGLSNKEAELYFSSNKNTMNHCVDSTYSGAVKVPVTTLDLIAGKTAPSAIKLDVEGYEKFVLEGGENTLAQEKLKVIIIELNGSGQTYGIQDREIIQMLHAYNFLPYHYLPKKREFVKLKDYNSSQFNTIFIRDFDMVNERTKSAEPISIWNQKF